MRYTARELPAYRFVPGDAPHPTRDPAGHSFGERTPVSQRWEPEEWRELDEWLWAVDLFNGGYWWESHEALEGLWHAAGRTTPAARFVQALVHLSAACLNRRRGHVDAARRQAARAVRGLRVAGDGVCMARDAKAVMGIDVERLIGEVERSFAREDGPPIRIALEMDAP